MEVSIGTPSPGNSDESLAQVVDLGKNLDHGFRNTSLEQTISNVVTLEPFVPSQGHRNLEKFKVPKHLSSTSSSGNASNLRVVVCSDLNLTADFDLVFKTFKMYGLIRRIKLKINVKTRKYAGYITFAQASDAKSSFEDLNGKNIGSSHAKLKLMNSENLLDEESDFIPDLNEAIEEPVDEEEREKPIPIWYVATYKKEQENYFNAVTSMEKHVGPFEDGNIKRYGKSILIKARNESQAFLLDNFRPNDEYNVAKISPHKTFNSSYGVIYSKELYALSESKILKLCPKKIYGVKKMKGTNNAILLMFSKKYVPDSVYICYTPITVKKYKPKPRQCHKCLEFGHIKSACRNFARCSRCSEEHEEEECTKDVSCLNCGDQHRPLSKLCPRFGLEQEILEVADTEHISIGSAKRQVMAANEEPGSTYASAVRKMKVKNAKKKSVPENRNNTTKSNQSKTVDRLSIDDMNNSEKEITKEKSTTVLERKNQPNPSRKNEREMLSHMEFEGTSVKNSRDDRDESCNGPSKRHRASNSPAKSEFVLKTNNSFSCLSQESCDNLYDKVNATKPKENQRTIFQKEEPSLNSSPNFALLNERTSGSIRLSRNFDNPVLEARPGDRGVSGGSQTNV